MTALITLASITMYLSGWTATSRWLWRRWRDGGTHELQQESGIRGHYEPLHRDICLFITCLAAIVWPTVALILLANKAVTGKQPATPSELRAQKAAAERRAQVAERELREATKRMNEAQS